MNENDQLPSPKRRRQPQPRKLDLMEQAAERGDVQFLIDQLERYNPFAGNPDVDKPFRLLRHALRQISKRSPEALIEESLLRVLEFQYYLMLRCQTYVHMHIQEQDREKPANGGNIPSFLLTEWLPRLARLQAEVKDTSRALASAHHVMLIGSKERNRSAEAA